MKTKFLLSVFLLNVSYVLIAQIIFIIVVLLIRPRGIGGMLDEFRE